MEEAGKKNDQNIIDKPMIGLVPLRAVWEVAKVMSFGAQKYDAFNWKGGIKYMRLINAALRHIIQFTEGEDTDSESGLSHLAHAACCILMLLEMTMDRQDLDDRYKGNKTLPWQAATEEKPADAVFYYRITADFCPHCGKALHDVSSACGKGFQQCYECNVISCCDSLHGNGACTSSWRQDGKSDD